MNPLRRGRNSSPVDEEPAAVEVEPDGPLSGKGRPTPKRRTSSRPAAPAPRTRKEAAAWQKEHARAKVAGQKKLSNTEYREAMRRGDPSVLPRRDQGPLRQLARDYVDSRRMASNYLLWLFPLYLLLSILPGWARYFQFLILFVFVMLVLEWASAARKIRDIAAERKIVHSEGLVSLAMYAGGRAYLRRSWRRPQPRIGLGGEY